MANASPSVTNAVIGTKVDIGKPIKSAVAIHLGTDAKSTNIIVDASRSNPGQGYIYFKSAFEASNAVISIFYIIIAE